MAHSIALPSPLGRPWENPPLDRTTVELALRLAPDKCPSPQDSEREIWMNVGARRLADRLLRILEEQENAP